MAVEVVTILDQLARELIHQSNSINQNLVKMVRDELTKNTVEELFNAFLESTRSTLSLEDFLEVTSLTIPYLRLLVEVKCKGKSLADVEDELSPFLHPILYAMLDLSKNCIALSKSPISSNIALIEQMEDMGGWLMLGIHLYARIVEMRSPKTKRSLGIYYTPPEVTSFITLSALRLVKKTLDQKSREVVVLDPSMGTGSFIVEAIKEDQSLPIVGVDLMPGAVLVGLINCSLLYWDLQHVGWDHLQVVNRNVLDPSSFSHGRWLVNKTAVVIGNPPYSGHSSNTGKWIHDLMRGTVGEVNYFAVGGKKLSERNPKWLNDDYVKFIRLAQWVVETAGEGVIAFITNNGWLDNPTFRGMRFELLKFFDEIYLLDLGGNSKKGDRTPDGKPDQNVFEIQQGVVVSFLVKSKENQQTSVQKEQCTIFYYKLSGSRNDKLLFLNNYSLGDINWVDPVPKAPMYQLTPVNEAQHQEYMKGVALPEIMPVHSLGVVTARDRLCVMFSPDQMWDIVTRFAGMGEKQAREFFELGKDTRDWKVRLAQNDILSSGPNKQFIQPILYRPFDLRMTYFTGTTRGFLCMPRTSVMRNMLETANIGLITTRQTKESWGMFVADSLVGHKTCAAYDSNSLFPLFLSEETNRNNLLVLDGQVVNLSLDFVKLVEARMGVTLSLRMSHSEREVTPTNILSYLYALSYSETYRKRYNAFLHRDFPRFQLPNDLSLFNKLAEVGWELIQLHLLNTKALPSRSVCLRGEGSNIVEKITQKSYRDMRVYINKEQYFEPIPPEVFHYKVGGYQPCRAWLRDRKETKLGSKDVMTYERIAGAIAKTIKLTAKIDRTIKEFGGLPLT